MHNGGEHSLKDLEARLSRIHSSLAHHHLLLAEKEWSKKESQKVGQDLQAAAEHVEDTIRMVEGKIDDKAASALRAAKDLGHKLVKGHKPRPEEVNIVVNGLWVVIPPLSTT